MPLDFQQTIHEVRSLCAGETDEIALMATISCHLYPIRVSKLNSVQALNYNNWDICKPACDCGEKLKLPVFRFLKNAIVRKWGDNFYSKLLKIEAHLKKSDDSEM